MQYDYHFAVIAILDTLVNIWTLNFVTCALQRLKILYRLYLYTYTLYWLPTLPTISEPPTETVQFCIIFLELIIYITKQIINLI